MQRARVLILAPVDESFHRIQETIQDAVDKAGMGSMRWDPLASGASRARHVVQAIYEADLVIADVTHGNPNVLYELGHVHALRKPAILIVNKDSQSFPSDLAGFNYIVYDPDNLPALGEAVFLAAQDLAARRRSA
ncbi:MAG: nucleotide-binding protein [Bryobacterales bacterium]|nr:nucleotide-binding protein [Bryobacterales bacterium]